MSSPTALYRRYRPDTFQDVIGQEHVTEPLMTALRKDRVNHAYLFSGPRGCGKTTSARILARCLNCEKGPTPEPCGVCPSCVELARGGAGSLDVIEIDAASHGGVDDARDLRERATFAPVRDRYKIFIIDEAHMVTSAGFNALLKIVEEPPEHIKFIFATTEPDKVIGTIRSRTHHYPFRLVPPEPLMAYLEQLCAAEHVAVAPGVLSLVVRAGGGSVRDSLSVLDQLMAGAGTGGIDYELAVALLGYTHAALLDDVVDAVGAGDSATVFRAVDRVIQTGHDPRRFVEDLLERFRDLIIVRALPDAAESILRGVPADQLARMRAQAQAMGASELSRAADVTNAAFNEMTGATSPRLHLELLCARLMLPAADGDQGLATRLDRLERRMAFGEPAGAGSAGAHASASDGSAEPTAPETTRPEQAAPADNAPAVKASEPESPAVAPRPEPSAVAQRPEPPAADAASGAVAPAGSAPAAPGAVAPAGSAPAAPTPEPTNPEPTAPEPTAPAAPAPREAASASPEPESAPAPSPAPTAPAGGSSGGAGSVEMFRRAWPEVLEALTSIKRLTWILVSQNANIAGFDGRTLTLAFANSGSAGSFMRGDHADNVRSAIHKVLGADVQIDATTGGNGPSPATARGAEAGPKAPADPNQRSAAPEKSAAPKPAASSPASGASRAEPAVSSAHDAPREAPAPSAADIAWGLASAPVGSDTPAGPGTASARPSATQSASAEPTPASTARERSVPGQSAPAQAVPGQSAPAQAVPGQSAPEHSVREDSVPERSEPGQFAPERHTDAEPHPMPVASQSAANGHLRPETAPGSPTSPARAGHAPAQSAPAGLNPNRTAAASSEPSDPYADIPFADDEPPAEWDEALPEDDGWRRTSPHRGTPSPRSAPPQPGSPSTRPAGSQPAAERSAADPAAAETRPGQPAANNTPGSTGGPSSGEPSSDPWVYARESAPGVWTVGSESNTSQGAQGSRGAQDSQPSALPEARATPEAQSSSSYAPAAAQPPARPTPESQLPAAQSQPNPTGSGGKPLSMYQRLSQRAAQERDASRPAAMPSPAQARPAVEDIPSADDETIEDSGLFGRAAVERILGGKLVEERGHDGTLIPPR